MEGGGGGVGFALVARVCWEGLKREEGRGEVFDGMDSEVRRFIEEGGWEE